MRSVIQRCNWCRVLSEGKVCGEIGKGLVALLGIKRGDTEEDALYISDKILHLRIFEDENNKMNLSLLGTKGALMIVSQFTLYGDSRHGRRPSFTEAELPKQASRLYEHVVRSCRIEGIKVEKISEKYTSGVSALDKKDVIKENYNKKIISRGVFVTIK